LAHDSDLLSADEIQGIEQAIAKVEAAMQGEDRDLVNALAQDLEAATKTFAERRMDRGIRKALAGMSVEKLAEGVQSPAEQGE
jgi:molecular chaperone HscA